MTERTLKTRPTHEPVPAPLPPFQAAGSFDQSEMILAPRLCQSIEVHLAHHLVPCLRARNPARFLVIAGAPGDGKTTGVKVLCSRREIDLTVISGGDLSGSTEDAALNAFNDTLAGIAKVRAGRKLPAALLIDDADLSVFATGREHVEYAVSSFVLQSALQKFADEVLHGDPLPVFVTVNQLDVFRAPLFRHGRANIYVHRLTRDEKVQQVTAMLGASTSTERALIDALVERHEHQPVAFFAAIKETATTQAIGDTIKELGVTGTVVEWAIRRKLKDLSIADFVFAADLQPTRPTGSFLSTGDLS